LNSVDFELLSIQYIHTKFFQNPNVIIITYFYQVQRNCHVRIFKTMQSSNNNNSLISNFWMEKIKYYELKQVMHQNDEQFIKTIH
jgi:hypothetical protein